MWDLLNNPNALIVMFGAVLISISAAVVGNFTFLRKRSLLGETVAHSVLPGICIAFIFTGQKDPLYLMTGAVIAGWISLLFVDVVLRNSRIKADTATALVLIIFFGLGIFLLTSIQHSGNAAQSGLDKFLFGNAASMLEKDLIVSGISAAVLLLTVFVFYRPFKLISFNREFALSIGLRVRFYEFLMSTLTILAVAIGIQAVGIVLMAALLITPAAAARYWTERLPVMLILSSVFAAISAFLATWVSFSLPSMPTGPWVIIVLSFIAISSIFFAPAKGLFWRRKLRMGHEKKILLENILKTFYYIRNGEAMQEAHSEDDLMQVRAFEPFELKKGLRTLENRKLVSRVTDNWQLTDKGVKSCIRIVRLHRLWELFLNKRLQLKPDHVHHGAEAIEHIITPEIEELLSSELGHPERDPHEKEIPGTHVR